MSSLKRSLFLSVFGAAMSGAVAFAADLPSPPIIEYEPEASVDIGSGWYLRGDLGYAIYSDPNSHHVNHTNGYTAEFYKESIKDGWLFGVGAGYYFSENFRADVTVDYRQNLKYKGKSWVVCNSPCTASEHDESNEFSAWTLMLNGYYDFGTYSAITPYVGAGVGLAYIQTDDHVSSGASIIDGDNWNVAWNVMAGASFAVADNVKFDTNYRFLSLGDVKTGDRFKHNNTMSNPVHYKDLYAHEFRVGLRYDLN